MNKLLIIALIVGLIIPICLPSAVYADGPYTYSVAAPDDIGFGIFSTVQIYTDETGNNITASSSDPAVLSVDITVKDVKLFNFGYMTLNGSLDQTASKLATALRVRGGSSQPTYTNLTGEPGIVLANDEALVTKTYQITDFCASQTIVEGDLSKQSGDYLLTLTFTATFYSE
jgi:hypothetical protein